MQIHIAAKQGNIAGVAQQLASGVEVDCLEEYSAQTPLMIAVTSPDASLEMLRFLVDQGADLNAVEEESQKPVLGFAVQSGNLDKVRWLLDAGADLHYQNPNGYDVLIDTMYGRDTARDSQLIPLLNLLIERGAPANGLSRYGESALKVASRIGRFDAVQVLLAAGADPQQLQWTALMHAIALEDVAAVQKLLEQDVDLSVRDGCQRTPWLLSLQVGELAKAKLLLAAGANPRDLGLCGKTPLIYAIENERIEVLNWLIDQGFKIEATDEFGNTPLMIAAESGASECVRILLERGADPSRENHYNNTAIKMATNLPIIRLLVAAGEDLSEISDEMRVLLTGVGQDDLQVSAEQYFAGRYPRFGQSNPEVMEIEFWQVMIRCGRSAYYAQAAFPDENLDGPVWCYYRFGRTITELPDGRIVEIAGEHEDYYDPDFCIYNDVVVYEQDGSFKIFGYPQDVFPPTDFHSATLVGGSIYIIGNLGYADSRMESETPVYRLDWETFRIEKVETTGEKPGWISRHKAIYQAPDKILLTGGQIYKVESDAGEYQDNLEAYILDLTDYHWTRT